MTIKERIIEQLDALDEVQLEALEEQLKWSKRENEAEKQERIKRQLEELRLSDEPAAPVSTQNREVFEEATHDG